ncbi:MAG: sel1 repeat family protein [Hahellaceae bacterium]|nr:sel1 repeat family protein [Hahellaceae bacterium]MCP5168321.1 sel1 repeat family protein [Hahellaceae bacterium]
MTSNFKTCLLALPFFMAACSHLPDQRLANQALLQGDTDTARWHYSELANAGYVDSQIALGDLYLRSTDIAQIKQAEAWYRKAAQSSPKAKTRLGKLLAKDPDATPSRLREAEGLLKTSLANGDESSLVPLMMLYVENEALWPNAEAQNLIDKGRAQGLPEADIAQIKLYRIRGTLNEHMNDVEAVCERRVNEYESCYPELANIYALKDDHGKLDRLIEKLNDGYQDHIITPRTLESVARVLVSPEIDAVTTKTLDSRIAISKQLLEAISGEYPRAWIRLARLAKAYPTQISTESLLDYIDHGKQAGLLEAELIEGRLYYEGRRVPMNPWLAEKHLSHAAQEFKAAHYMLGQIYRRGYLGSANYTKALEHLLIAARDGQASADFALAEMFSSGIGIKANRATAYVFAHFANASGLNNERVVTLYQSLKDSLTRQEWEQAVAQIQRETQTRNTPPMLISQRDIIN